MHLIDDLSASLRRDRFSPSGAATAEADVVALWKEIFEKTRVTGAEEGAVAGAAGHSVEQDDGPPFDSRALTRGDAPQASPLAREALRPIQQRAAIQELIAASSSAQHAVQNRTFGAMPDLRQDAPVHAVAVPTGDARLVSDAAAAKPAGPPFFGATAKAAATKPSVGTEYEAGAPRGVPQGRTVDHPSGPDQESVQVFRYGESISVIVRDAALSSEQAVLCALQTVRCLTGESGALRKVILNGRTVFGEVPDQRAPGTDRSTLIFAC